MKMLGAHLSIQGGFYKLRERMDKINANTCAFFVKSTRSFRSKELTANEIKQFKSTVKNKNLVVHGSYMINLANIGEKTIECFHDDLDKCAKLGIKNYVFHPGSDVKKRGRKIVAREIAREINKAGEKFPTVDILIENMAGQGNVFGKNFEELADILKHVEISNIGICLDTCHLFSSGYDLRTKEMCDRTFEKFEKIIGFKTLKVIHLADSKTPFNSRRDRHEMIGKGSIGLECFKYIMNDNRFDDIPMILETPVPEKYKEEIELLRNFN